MKKRILSLFSFLLPAFAFAQTGSITVVSIPDQIEAGATVDLEFTYTSDVEVDFVVQLFQTQENSLAVDYNTWQTAVTVLSQPAGTDVPITVSFTIPHTIDLSSSLTDREYTFDLKLTTVSGSTDFGWSNGTANHTVEILESSVVLDIINFTAATPTSVNPGEDLVVDFEYTLSEVRNVKAGLAIYTSGGEYVANAVVNQTEVADYFSDEPATSTTPVQQTGTISVPAEILPSSELPAGQGYRVVVSIFTTEWEYIADEKNEITVNDPLNITGSLAANELNVYPNPATDEVYVSCPGIIKSVTLYAASGPEITAEATESDNGRLRINTSNLEKGMYILKVTTNEGTSSIKLMK